MKTFATKAKAILTGAMMFLIGCMMAGLGLVTLGLLALFALAAMGVTLIVAPFLARSSRGATPRTEQVQA